MRKPNNTKTVDIGPVIDLLAKALKSKRIKYQDVSKSIGKAPSWFTGVLFRKHHVYLDDFLAVCYIAGIDPIMMLAEAQEGGIMRYVKDVTLIDLVNHVVQGQLRDVSLLDMVDRTIKQQQAADRLAKTTTKKPRDHDGSPLPPP